MVLFRFCVFWSQFMLFALTYQSKAKEGNHVLTWGFNDGLPCGPVSQPWKAERNDHGASAQSIL